MALSASLRKLPGVAEAKLDVDARKAVVSYDSAAQSVIAGRQEASSPKTVWSGIYSAEQAVRGSRQASGVVGTHG